MMIVPLGFVSLLNTLATGPGGALNVAIAHISPLNFGLLQVPLLVHGPHGGHRLASAFETRYLIRPSALGLICICLTGTYM